MEMLLAELITKYPVVLLALTIVGLLVVVAQVVVMMTPSKKDDELMAKIEANPIGKKLISIFVSFAPIQKSQKGLELSNTSLGKKE